MQYFYSPCFCFDSIFYFDCSDESLIQVVVIASISIIKKDFYTHEKTKYNF